MFLWLNQFYEMQIKNYALSMRLMIPGFITALEKGQDLTQSAKFLSSEHVKLITRFLETRAKITYGDFLYRLCAVLIDEGLIKQYGEEEYREIRYLKMFRTFDDCIFCKNFSYQFYQDNINDFLEHVKEDRAKSFNNIRDKIRACKTDLGRFKAILPKTTEEYDLVVKYEKWLTTAFLHCLKLSKSSKGFPALKIRFEQNSSCPLPVVFLDKVKK